jgi:sugar phosphate isomerase/epimerase
MSLSPLPLPYCTNVHPGNTTAEVLAGLERHAAEVARMRAAAGKAGPLGVGLWLSRPVASELAGAGRRRELVSRLSAMGLECHTLNAFPFGDFHGRRVKENVYRPDWADPARAAYTLDCAAILADLLPPRGEGSISTLPLSFKTFRSGGPSPSTEPWDAYADALIVVARGLHRLYRETGRTIRLAVEPEPFCTLETTAEALSFFARLFARADESGLEPLAREYLGLCYDVCHQAVEFEDVTKSVADIDRAGVRINKVHITCAVELPDPAGNAEGRSALSGFVEERYLHQTFARLRDGRILKTTDLTAELANDPPAEWRSAEAWRIHFHVPVGLETMGPLRTTRPALRDALSAVARLPYAPHLEVETYTWDVLPGRRDAGKPSAPLAEGLAAELAATEELLAGLR